MRAIGFGFAFAAGAAIGNSCIDGSRKFASQRFSITELIGIVGFLDAILLVILVLVLGKGGSINTMFEGSDVKFLRIVVISAGLKVIAGFLYQKALHLSPLSVTVPYLAFTPVLLVFTSFFMMHETPSYQGLLGVLVVTIGGYLLAVEQPGDPEIKKERTRSKSLYGLLASIIGILPKWCSHLLRGREKSSKSIDDMKKAEEMDEVNQKILVVETDEKQAFHGLLTNSYNCSIMDGSLTTHIFEPFLALKREQGSLLMLGVAGLLSVSNSLDKMGAHLAPSPIIFAALQKVIMAIPLVLFLSFHSLPSFKHVFRQFHVLLMISIFEIVAFICYLKSLETLLVAYAIAAKRSNVLITVFIGKLVFKEKILKRLPFILLMVGGMTLIILA